MKQYYETDQTHINFDDSNSVTKHYNKGYVLTRLGRGILNQTRSLRIDLQNFELNSENRRILRKTDGLNIRLEKLPLADYSWEIHKLGKDFYTTKFGDHTMSASKIKDMFVNPNENNTNTVFIYSLEDKPVGYCLSYENEEIIHYSYPFYDLEVDMPNLGMGMMIRAIEYAKRKKKKYFYLGSVVDQSSKYKLQFDGLEWWDEKIQTWNDDLVELKDRIS